MARTMATKVVIVVGLLVAVMASANAAIRPVVLMHGLMASAEAMSHAQAWIEADFPGIYVHNAEVGNGKTDSLFMEINKQCDALAANISGDPKLANGFDIIGHSQGGLLTRCYVERYNDPPVHNLISWAGPEQGVYGVPDFNIPWLDKIMSEIDEGGWASGMQDLISFATYWKDPYNMSTYLEVNQFLADINNERPTKNATYKSNMLSLNAFSVTYSTVDEIVVPRESETWGFYAPGQSKTVTPFNETDAYQGDWLGLKTLDQAGKLSFHPTSCKHADIPRDSCKDTYTQFTKPLLGGSL